MASRHPSGQTLLIVVLIGVLLILSIPVVILINQVSATHQVGSQKRSAAESIAAEGISYMSRQLGSSDAIWSRAVNGDFSATDCFATLGSMSGDGNFQIDCSTGNTYNRGLQPYQVAVVATASIKNPDGSMTKLRAVQAYLSKRTVGADLSSGFHVAAAMQLSSTPTFNTPLAANPLTVHWGPVVVLDTHTWILNGVMDKAGGSVGYPRKISLGGITGANYARVPNTDTSAGTTDAKEYWAFASYTYPPHIDTTTYVLLSTNSTGIGAAGPWTWHGGAPPGNGRDPRCTVDCAAYVTNGSTALFNGSFAVPYSTAIIVIQGNAEFSDLSLDLANGGAVIVTGNLILSTHTTGSGFSPGTGGSPPLNVPIGAVSDYYYSPNLCPCSNSLGGTCNWSAAGLPNSTPVNFRGFLWVMNRMLVLFPGWTMVGVIQVGDLQSLGSPGRLIMRTNADLTLVYDDLINHKIIVNPAEGTSLKIVADVYQDIQVR